LKPESTEHPQAALTRRPPDPIRVGGGTAFFLEGTLDPGGMPLERVSLKIGQRERVVDAHSMPDQGSYGAGGNWWSMVVVEGERSAEDIAAALIVEGGGRRFELELGDLRLGERFEGLPEPGDIPAGLEQVEPDQPLIAICMATYEPTADRLRRQLDSIREQIWRNWVCVISDDHSSPKAYADLQSQIAGDPRFILDRAPERLGFLRNFERAIRLAPEAADLISLADQDDRWDPDKLEVLAGALLANGSSRLVYSDVRIADSSGVILSESYWFERRNSYDSMATMMVANNVTGAAAMFRRELLDVALPFPPTGTGQEVYHDQWLALCALASGPLTYVDRPTHDYTRHQGSVTILETDGQWVVPPQGRREQLLMRWKRFARRLHVASRSPGWRAVYVGRYLLIRQLATMLELRLGRAGIEPVHLRDLDRFLAAESSPRAAAWLLARSFRPWIGQNDTLSRERAIFGGILWRHVVARRSSPDHKQGGDPRQAEGPRGPTST
jgi:glycosyltransferase involved in cell wall biosynthesis